MCDWIVVGSYNVHTLNEQPCLVLTGPEDFHRYVVGTWKCGKGWVDSYGNSINHPVAFKKIEVPAEYYFWSQRVDNTKLSKEEF